MFGEVTRIEKIGEHALVLHRRNGKPVNLLRTFVMFRFEGSDVTLRTRSDFQSTARTYEGRDLGGSIAASEYVRKDIRVCITRMTRGRTNGLHAQQS